MKLIKMKNRELFDLIVVLIIAVIFSIFSISINFIDRLYNFFNAYTSLPIAEFLINVVFLSLVGLLWLTYRRWRETSKKQTELENIIESISPDVLMVVDPDRDIIMCNPSVKRMFGYEVDEVINQKTDMLYFDRRSNQKQPHEIFDMLERECFHIGLATGKKKNGETIPLEIITGNLNGRGGAVLLLRDITERKRAEEHIKTSLKEKEVLLKEIHHRVKNNLQVISSLLNLQAGYIADKEVLDMFMASQNRVKSMALIHERLYRSEGVTKIDFGEYIRNLTPSLFHSYGVRSDTITLKINADDALLSVDAAIPCGLIINELVSNSLKYAFPEGKQTGEISIDLYSDDQSKFILVVSDNGVGFPKDLDFKNTQSLGLQLVNTLTNQLGGTIELDRSNGTAFKITFTPLEIER